MGFFPDMLSGAAHVLEDPKGKEWYDRIKAGDGVNVALELIGLFSQGEFPTSLIYYPESQPYKDAWARFENGEEVDHIQDRTCQQRTREGDAWSCKSS